MVVCLVDCLVDWLVGWLIDCLFGCLVELDVWLFGCLVGFIGCLVYNCDKNFGLHTGYVIAYAIIQKLLDQEEISLERESLYEPKSIINEDITKFPKGFKLNYLHTENKNPEKYNEKFITKAVIVDNNNNVLIETPVYTASNKQENEQKAAKYLLTNNNYKNLKRMYNIL